MNIFVVGLYGSEISAVARLVNCYGFYIGD